MTARGTPSVLWAENKTAAPAPAKPHSSPARELRVQFREAARAVIQRLAHSPAPRRKRRDETGRGFRIAATPVTSRPPMPPAISRAVVFLEHTLDWLHLWNWNQDTQLDHFDHGGQHYKTLDL